MAEKIRSNMPTWVAIVLAIAMLSVMGAITYQQWYKYTHPTPIAQAGATKPAEHTPAEPTTEQTAQPNLPEAGGDQVIQLEQVSRIIAMKDAPAPTPIDGITYFRSASGNEVCAYSSDVSKLESNRWVAMAPEGDSPFTGPGVVCSQVRGALEPKAEDRARCKAGTLHGRGATLTPNRVGYGSCSNNGVNPTQVDAKNEKNERMSAIPAIPNGSYVKLGEDFVCGSVLPEFGCASLQSGKAFYLGVTSYKLWQ